MIAKTKEEFVCFFYLIQLDKDVSPTWGKVGKSADPLRRLTQAQAWWPRPKLLREWNCTISDEKEIISYMKQKLKCKFFGKREIFKCEDFDKLIKGLDKWFFNKSRVVIHDWTRSQS